MVPYLYFAEKFIIRNLNIVGIRFLFIVYIKLASNIVVSKD